MPPGWRAAELGGFRITKGRLLSKRRCVILAACAAVAATIFPSTTAGAQPTSRLGLIQDYQATPFTRAYSALGGYFWDKGSSYESGYPLAGSATTPLRWFASLAAFRRAVGGMRRGSWAMLDLESWDQAVPSEKTHPAATMEAFNALGYAHGINVIEAPALDLAYIDKECGDPGLAVDWYLKCDIAGAASSYHARIVVTQTQSQTQNAARFGRLFRGAQAQVAASHQGAAVYADISQRRDNGSVADAVADVRSANPAGLMINCPRGSLSWEARVLRKLEAAGY